MKTNSLIAWIRSGLLALVALTFTSAPASINRSMILKSLPPAASHNGVRP